MQERIGNQAMDSRESPVLRVCTYNIRFIFDRWLERRQVLLETLAHVDVDVIGLQEVLIGGYFFGQQKEIIDSLEESERESRLKTNSEKRTMHWRSFDSPGARSYITCVPLLGLLFANPIAFLFYDLCSIFNEYFLCQILGKYVQMLYHNALTRVVAYVSLGTAFVFGTTMIVKQLPSDDEMQLFAGDNQLLRPSRYLSLRVGGWRSAQAIIGTIGKHTVMIVNVHLSSARHEEDIRVDEAKQICDWIDNQTDSIDGSIIMGDFNCYPDEPCYTYFTSTRNYRSAYKTVHGCEPIKTFHQDHDCITKDIDDEATLDYVLFKGSCFGAYPFHNDTKSSNASDNCAVNNQGQDIDVELVSSTQRRYNTRQRNTVDRGDEVVHVKEKQHHQQQQQREQSYSFNGCCTDVSKDVYLIGTTPAQGDQSLYPSDHYGIIASFILQ